MDLLQVKLYTQVQYVLKEELPAECFLHSNILSVDHVEHSEYLQLNTCEPLSIILPLIALSSYLVIALGVTLYSVDGSIIILVCLAVSAILIIKWIFS